MATTTVSRTTHGDLACGIEYAVVPMPHRRVVTFQIRVFAGGCADPEDKLGLAHIVEETIDKGTEKRSGRKLSDALDAIGATGRSATGRETTTIVCTVLPEYFEQAVALHAEFLRQPTFPDDACRVAVDLAGQELLALDDDAHGLADKLLGQHAYGPMLGRHPLGEKETLATITRDDIVQHWRAHYHAGRMLVAVGGAIEPQQAGDVFEKHFAGFGSAERAGRSPKPVAFTEGRWHYHKALKQQQIGIAWPGVAVTDDAFPVQQVTLGILAGGMSGRLFTEIREKQGLVYWVSAWHETPRASGMLFMGASSTPERCDKTFASLLKEVDRLADDIQPKELERAVTGIVASDETRGDSTGARCGELAADIFHFNRPVPTEEKIQKIQAVTIDNIKQFLDGYPRDRLCVVTLGPRALAEG